MKKNEVLEEILEIIDDLYFIIVYERASFFWETAGSDEPEKRMRIEEAKKETQTKLRIKKLFEEMK